jgi:STE24 endopeptidase
MTRCFQVSARPNTNWRGELRRTAWWMSSRKIFCLSMFVVVLCFLGAAARGQDAPGPGAKPATAMPSVLEVPPAAQPSDHFDAVAATDAYLAQIPEEARSRSDAYFEGGYWLILWDFLFGAIINFLFLYFRWSARMRDWAERTTRFKPLQTAIYWVQFLLVSTVLGFPLTIYEGYMREHKYGLATQMFGPWLGDQVKGLLIGLIIGGIAVMLLIGIVRRLPRTWWIWGAVVAIIFMAFLVLISPVYLFPIFNTIKPLDDARITTPILKMAHANGIAVDKVFEIDASRQSTRMSANVSGLGKTMRITLNDNLLKRGSLPEIQFVMGHEMGHYVLHHIPKDMIFFFVVIVAAFGFLRWSVEWALKHWGEQWQIRGITDVAVLPLVFLMGSIFFFVLTPILNTQTRTNEGEADMYGLNASRQPDGAAQAAIHLGEYRKMNPGPVEEFFFFDHPSGRNRIFAAMRWKAQNLQLFAPPATVTPAASVREPAPIH